jgi:hypothetical protein
MDPQCFLTEIAAKGLVRDQSRRIARELDDQDSWPLYARWPIGRDPGDNAPCYPWEHTPAPSPSHEPLRRGRPLRGCLQPIRKILILLQ